MELQTDKEKLAKMLQKYFGCKRPFLKNPQVLCSWPNGDADYEYLAHGGGAAYGKLTSLISDIGEIVGDNYTADMWIDALDSIVVDADYVC